MLSPRIRQGHIEGVVDSVDPDSFSVNGLRMIPGNALLSEGAVSTLRPGDRVRVVCRWSDRKWTAEALELVRERFAAGRPCRGYEVDRAARSVIEEAGHGEAFLHRTGHSIGVEVHGHGANIDNLETRDERLILRGTCFSIEPGIYLAGRMAARTEIDVFITPAGTVEVCGPIQEELIRIG